MLKPRNWCGLTLVLSLCGLGCESMQQQRCCSSCNNSCQQAAPCVARPACSTCSACTSSEKVAPCQPQTCSSCSSCNPCDACASSSSDRSLFAAFKRAFSPYGQTTSNCSSCSQPCGCSGAAPAPTPVVRTSFNPFAVTESGQQSCAPCAVAAASQAGVVTRPVESRKVRVIIVGCVGCQTTTEAGAPIQQAQFNPFAITEDGQQVMPGKQSPTNK
jgi:hypothetical protein